MGLKELSLAGQGTQVNQMDDQPSSPSGEKAHTHTTSCRGFNLNLNRATEVKWPLHSLDISFSLRASIGAGGCLMTSFGHRIRLEGRRLGFQVVTATCSGRKELDVASFSRPIILLWPATCKQAFV